MKKFAGVFSAVVCSALFAGLAQAQLPDPAQLSSQWLPKPPPPVVAPKPAFDPAIQAQLDVKVAEVLARHGGVAAVSIDDGRHTYFAGNVGGGPAMSTIKVPIAIAAERNGTANPDDVAAALTWSDNAATDRLYAGLGPEADAKIRGVISPAPAINAGSWWANNQWGVVEQAQFARRLDCVDPDRSITHHMGNVVPEQRYGLGRVPGMLFKGGWSPMDDGKMYVRQLGVLHTDQGAMGVAIAAQAGDGSYAAAQAMLNELADALPRLGSPLHC
ncbi:hypothetical protein [Corynebacterium sp. H130]|uniref:hypothetical protein n=1 Tax=Corynebacterium sp. H130 TaxID=3133444 RepID=UPI0030A72AAA